MIFHFIFALFIILIYYGLNYFSEQLILKEYKNIENRISKTKIHKTVSRRNELFEYEFPLNPNLEKFNLRFLAKLIDFGFYYLISVFIKNNFESLEFVPFFTAFLSLFLINPIFEFLTGKTVGKFIFGLEVIDDKGTKPSFLISYMKNLLQLGIIIVFVASYSSFWEDEIFFHNKKTLTYTIKAKNKKEILEKIKN